MGVRHVPMAEVLNKLNETGLKLVHVEELNADPVR